MKNLSTFLVFLLSLSAFAGMPKGVNWHTGTIEKAFEKAAKQNKNLFLYWGAVWCPPCNHIKKKVFTSPEFKKEIKNFLPVYLDGDTDRAQIWGEKLKASGYPTMLVLTPKGKELMRFPTTVDAKKYTELLRASLKNQSSIVELLNKKEPTDEQWSQLAFYSWGQNQEIENKFKIYERLYKKVPARLKEEKTALYLNYLAKVVKKKKPKIKKEELSKEFASLINQKALAKKFASDLSYSGAEYIDFLFDKVEDRIQHHAKLQKLMDELSNDKSLTVEERLFALAYEMNLALEDESLLPGFQQKLLKKVAETNKVATDIYTRQDAMSTAIWMLKKSKLFQEAKSYGEKELKKSVSPHYFMSYLSSIEKELGNTKGAIEWKRKAWEAAEGGSTRFQWGTSYLTTLIENNKKKTFAMDFKTIISELLTQEDAFNGRNKKRLERLKKALVDLKDKTFDFRVKAILIEQCSKLKDGKSCHSNFKELKLI